MKIEAMNNGIFLKQLAQPLLFLLYLVLVFLLWYIDFATGPDLSFLVFYLGPIFLATWFSGKNIGIVVASCSALAWFLSDVMTRSSYPHPLVPYWNVAIKFSIFLIIVELLSRLKRSLSREKELARKDELTGTSNRRAFYESAQIEIDRMHRYKHPFTLAFIDLDNFKHLNDTFGHTAGDRVLRIVSSTIIHNIRSTDTVARIGGDEFILLLSETGFVQAQAVVEKLRLLLLERMHKGKWPITFSIGVVTYLRSPSSVDEVVKIADNLMFTAKREGKDRIKHIVWKESSTAC